MEFGDVVKAVNGSVSVNALVVQSIPQADGEHLTVVFLDPKQKSPLLSGANVDKAIQRAFLTPLTEGKTYGWKPLELSDDAQSITGELAQAQDVAEALRKELETKVDPAVHQQVVDALAHEHSLNKSLTDANGALAAKVEEVEKIVSEQSAALTYSAHEIADLTKKLKANPTSGDSSVPATSNEPESTTETGTQTDSGPTD